MKIEYRFNWSMRVFLPQRNFDFWVDRNGYFKEMDI